MHNLIKNRCNVKIGLFVKWAPIIVVLILLVRCNSDHVSQIPEEDRMDKMIGKDSVSTSHNILFAEFGLDTISDARVLVQLLNDSGSVDEAHVGFTGETGKTYLTYLRLSEVASNEYLKQLLVHQNPKVRVYAAWAMLECDTVYMNRRWKDLQYDTATVMHFSGCIGMNTTVAYLIRSRYPVDAR